MTDTVEITSFEGLDPRISILRAGSEVDAMFVRTQRFDVLIDTLGTPALCRQALEKLCVTPGGKPLVILNSHMDWDHFWGNAALGEFGPIIGHVKTQERLAHPAARAKLAEKSGQESRFHEVELIGPSITFSGDMTLHGGDLTLHLLHTPGHTPDHVAVYIPEIATLLPVDAVEDPMPCVWSKDPDALVELRRSLRQLRDLRALVVAPAHGHTTTPEAIERNIAYFDALERRVAGIDRKTLQEATTPETIPGLAMEDCVPVLRVMDDGETAFYRDFHQRNLIATIRERLRQTEIA